MAAKNVEKYREMRVFSGDAEVFEASWDFSRDGGATTDTYAFMKAKEKMFITKAFVETITGVTGSGGMTFEIGVIGSSTAAVVAQTAKTSFASPGQVVAGAVTGGAFFLNTDDVVGLTIGTGAATAGKVKLVLQLMRATGV